MPITPVLIRAQDGSWLAVAPPESATRVGAIGATEQEARLRFEEAEQRIRRALGRGVDMTSPSSGRGEPVKIPLDPEDALRALLKVDPDSEPAQAEQEAAAGQEREYPGDETDEG